MIRVLNHLDSDHDRCSVGPDLGPNNCKVVSRQEKCHVFVAVVFVCFCLFFFLFFFGGGGEGSYIFCILIYSHAYGIGEVKAHARLCICTGSPESLHGHVCDKNHFQPGSSSVVEWLTRYRGAVGTSLTGVTALWSLSKTHLS